MVLVTMQAQSLELRQNALLRVLDEGELSALATRSRIVRSIPGQNVCGDSEQPDVCFPLQGLLLVLTSGGRGIAVNTGTIGPSGMYAPSSGSKNARATRCDAATAGAHLLFDEAFLSALCGQNLRFRDVVASYHARSRGDSHASTACALVHGLKERLCGWIANVSDHSQGDVSITQQLLASFLGADRGQLNGVIGDLVKQGVIALPARGKIRVVDKIVLRKMSCGCG